ncbi:alpha/beta fold hydrolase [Comamonas endophytica]|uniref:Alpha/beta hydrolase n=1 Tax=Comamonas endophytica TaxID=2949090 RepID=A0ABY6GAB1_9BURK|nr:MULTISPECIES: alpha/beta hydrolase [unclassified Acidovorax]MCD2514006.1 alpha/beta hydrolase [Acidovorax sp. D4N7]UYG52004.1 alpha/beta hydrolase [Acidovorax sp. 5MLIR]
MNEPTLNYVLCPGAATAAQGAGNDAADMHRMAYWEWNATGNPEHPHVIVCVHGLSRQARDFDVLARALSRHARVVCPDVAGRGQSDWLADPMDYVQPRYASDMQALVAQLQARSPIQTLDWVGTSMGGLIGMLLASRSDFSSPVPIRRLVLNDIGPRVQWQALLRIGEYLGKPLVFTSLQQAAEALRLISAGFGPHTEQQWLDLTAPMLKPRIEGGLELHYDPDIAIAFQAMNPDMALASEAWMWSAYDSIQAQTLLIRGAQSDLLSVETAHAMAGRGPRARCVTLPGIGHAPTLVAADQVALVAQFLLPGWTPEHDEAAEPALAGAGA